MNNYRKDYKGKCASLVLFGTGDMARIALEYFTRDSEYTVVAFAVDREYTDSDSFCGLPLIPYDVLPSIYPPSMFSVHVCMVYNNMNRDRASKCAEVKADGYSLASYISSHSFVSPSSKIGEHAFIFEDNTVQPYTDIGNNVILWSGNHIGHDSKIRDNVFISSHVVVSGWCDIGENCFIGVNSTLANGTTVGEGSWLSHGSVVSGSIPSGSFVKSATTSLVTSLNEDALNRALQRARV